MCKYCEDSSFKREDSVKEECSYPHFYGDLVGISLHYKFEVLPDITKIYAVPHFCPMCGKKLLI